MQLSISREADPDHIRRVGIDLKCCVCRCIQVGKCNVGDALRDCRGSGLTARCIHRSDPDRACTAENSDQSIAASGASCIFHDHFKLARTISTIDLRGGCLRTGCSGCNARGINQAAIFIERPFCGLSARPDRK